MTLSEAAEEFARRDGLALTWEGDDDTGQFVLHYKKPAPIPNSHRCYMYASDNQPGHKLTLLATAPTPAGPWTPTRPAP